MPIPFARRSFAAFTLIELLTVIAIIGILAAIIIPTVGAVRAKAAQTKSISNLRQFGTAMAMFANDNRNRLPTVTDNRPGNVYGSWDMGLLPYLSVKRDGLNVGTLAETLFFHPRDPAPVRTDGRARRTYAMNSVAGGPGVRNGTSMMTTRITNPGKVILVGERPGSSNSFAVGLSFANLDNPQVHIVNQMAGKPDLNPGGKYNFLFADGHVATYALIDTIGTGDMSNPRGLWTVADGD